MTKIKKINKTSVINLPYKWMDQFNVTIDSYSPKDITKCCCIFIGQDDKNVYVAIKGDQSFDDHYYTKIKDFWKIVKRQTIDNFEDEEFLIIWEKTKDGGLETCLGFHVEIQKS